MGGAGDASHSDGRTGEVDDLIGTILFLSSPASDYMTGQTLYVDGGWTAT